MPRRLSKFASCHPDRPHHGRGLCELCYIKEKDVREERRVRHKHWVSKNKEHAKNYWRQWVYGLTPERYAAIKQQQQDRCAVCFRQLVVVHVDHNHKCCPGDRSCGHCVRGLLCEDCNRGLGSFHDDPIILLNAIEYLLEEANGLGE